MTDCEGLDLSACICVRSCGYTVYLNEGRE